MSTHGTGGTKARIASAALELFCAHGYDGTSMRDLAAHLGLTPAALYYHYASKEEILIALVEPLLVAVEDLLADPTLADAGKRTRLECLHKVIVAHPTTLRLVVSDVAIASHPRVRARVGEVGRRLPDLLTDDRSDTEERIRAVAAVGALLRTVVALESDEISANAEHILDAAGRALGVPRRRRPPTPAVPGGATA